MKTLISFVVVFAMLALAIPAEAQYYARDRRAAELSAAIAGGYGYRGSVYGRGSYYGGYYDPATLQQMMNLPEALEACSIDFQSVQVLSCRPVAKSADAIQAFGTNHAGNEILGTVHFHKGHLHFRPFDDTDHRLGTYSAGALGAGAGYIATAGARGWVRGSATVGGGLLAGWLASRHNHDNCLIIERSVTQSANLTQQSNNELGSDVEQAPEVAKDRKIVRNRFEEASVRIYEGSHRVTELPAGADTEIDVTSPDDIWAEAHLINPKNGKREWIPLQNGAGFEELPKHSGWLFGNPNTKPTL